jgi:hypothetical protein
MTSRSHEATLLSLVSSLLMQLNVGFNIVRVAGGIVTDLKRN